MFNGIHTNKCLYQNPAGTSSFINRVPDDQAKRPLKDVMGKVRA